MYETYCGLASEFTELISLSNGLCRFEKFVGIISGLAADTSCELVSFPVEFCASPDEDSCIDS